MSKGILIHTYQQMFAANKPLLISSLHHFQTLISLELHGHPIETSGASSTTRPWPPQRRFALDLTGYDVTDSEGVSVNFVAGNKCNAIRLDELGVPEEIVVIHAPCAEAARDLDPSETSSSDHREAPGER